MIRTFRSTFSNTLGTQRKRYLIGVVVLVGLMSLFRLETPAKFQDDKEKQDDNLASLLRLDKTVRPVTFLDTKGGKWPLLEQKEAKAIVVAFLDFKCPISNRYVPILNELVEKYSAKGVVVAAVICDVESPEELDRHAKEFRTGFKVFYDPTHILSNHFLADTAPQVYIWWKQLRRFWQKNRSPLNTPKQSVAPLDALKKKSSPMGKSLFTRMCFPYYKTIARFVIVREMWLRFRYSLLRMR